MAWMVKASPASCLSLHFVRQGTQHQKYIIAMIAVWDLRVILELSLRHEKNTGEPTACGMGTRRGMLAANTMAGHRLKYRELFEHLSAFLDWGTTS